MISEFKEGLLFWWNGWKWLWGQKRLGWYAVIPFFLSAAFSIAAFFIIVHHIAGWSQALLQWLFNDPNFWSQALYYPLWFSLFLLTLVMTIYFGFLIQGILASPFYSLLAERCLIQVDKLGDTPFRWKQWLRLSLRMLRVSTIKSIIFAILGILVFVFSFIPILNFVAILLALMIMAFDNMDYSFEALGFHFRQRMGYFRSHFAQLLGMAVGLGLTLIVPGLTFLILPGAVAGAARIVRVPVSTKGDVA